MLTIINRDTVYLTLNRIGGVNIPTPERLSTWPSKGKWTNSKPHTLFHPGERARGWHLDLNQICKLTCFQFLQYSYVYLTNRFQVAMCLFSNRSQRMSKCDKNISGTLGCASCATFLFVPHFDLLCDLLLNRRKATWNLFVLYNKELKKVLMMTSSICLSSNRS